MHFACNKSFKHQARIEQITRDDRCRDNLLLIERQLTLSGWMDGWLGWSCPNAMKLIRSSIGITINKKEEIRTTLSCDRHSIERESFHYKLLLLFKQNNNIIFYSSSSSST